jgi:hypothetical protein
MAGLTFKISLAKREMRHLSVYKAVEELKKRTDARF